MDWNKPNRNSRLDFLVGNTYLEVKTPLHFIDLEIPSYIKKKQHSPLTSTDRFVKHICELKDSLKTHQRAIELNVFIYDANDDEILQNFKWEEGQGLNLSDEINLLNRKNHYEIVYKARRCLFERIFSF